WDPGSQTGNKVWAGGVNGGLWYNNDITSATSSWNKVNDFWSNIAVTCIAFDPLNSQTMYVGTGEGFTSNSGTSARGAGIFKSTDGGATWSQLGATTSYYWVLDIVVRDEGGSEGVVYAAVDGRYYAGDYHGLTVAGIRRSTNGGASFSNVSPNVPGETIKFIPSDLEIGANNRLWCGTKASSYSATDRGGGYVLYSDNGTTWTQSTSVSVSNGSGRVAIACAPSDSNTVYALVESGGQLHAVIQTSNYGSSWNTKSEPNDADNDIPSTDFTRGQAWYDLVIAVDPNDKNVVIAGGIDLFRSTNGGGAWTQISKWSNNNNLANLTCSEVHADQHAIVFKPGSSSTAVFGNDGGIYYTTSISTSGSNDVILERNKDYNVTQYYSCAIHPSSGSNVYLAGSQDNGTQRYSSAGINSTARVYGGDGGFCFIDQSNSTVAIASYIYNNFYLSTNTGQNFPNSLIQDYNTGKFINPADYHDADNVLYSGKGTGTLWRIRNVTTSPTSPETINVTGMSDEASHVRCSPYSSSIFVGSDVGEIFKVTSANGTYSVSDITGGNMPAGSVSCIEIGANDDELLVTFFNYGVVSVWYTSNGGSTWVSKEGNLPNMPVRWALFNPNDRNEVILATDLGVWSTTDLSVASPTWSTSNNGLANTRVDMLQIRDADKMVIAATHGRGLFSSDAFAAQAPIADFTSDRQSPCEPQKVSFTDLSVFDPTGWKWSFNPSTVTFVDGTGDTSRNPVVTFDAPGNYTVSLTASNSLGSDIETKNAFITVSAASVPDISIAPDANPTCLGATVTFTATPVNGGTAPTYQWKKNGVNVGSNAAIFTTSNLVQGDTISCEMVSNDSCAFPLPVNSNEVIMQINNGPTVTLFLTDPNSCINEDPFNLDGGMPAGGSYSGPGVTNNQFDPVMAGFGAHTITYTFTDNNGCSNSATDVMNVSNIPPKPSIQRTANTNSLQSSETAAFYEWSVDGVVLPSAINRNLTITQSGT
ncbi:MAG: PKD domain-containing protein, partial [Bacteroidota bacterium]|nr:PKD domain-containing protein [Bacteroidota bacterium]MDX5429727.1 PKD domain-containing protein [Bacteroidota bacterium]MDX5468508.1 PKD domain-containing protein [Bacteroidota bacterium]